MPQLTTPEGRRITYDLTPGAAPAVVFLGGFRSDMEGTKAVDLRDWAIGAGRAFLRFDYSGHGVSEGRFEDGCIGDWFEDARAALGLIDGPAVLVGSSMGGWIALLLARALPEKVAALVGIAAAPDFTEDLMWDGFDADQRAAVMAGAWPMPSPYGEPTPITRRLIEDGRDRLVLRDPLPLPMPVRLLQGTADAEVPVAVALRLLDHADAPDIRLTLVKGADHRFSSEECLALIRRTVADVAG
ncbi:alpha/beta fold hydrolase [Falsirhodobacter algicola]|uniref:Palmitoyl-protein thioesterase ABHD10, mitochondrial n=1 Tax=Falsirhodobacter algicola TaxID=2692330 RepID=A0A8J8MST3_9RHOB|nr:alpha/beta fold hydrolase [Falsirhodobacter algicola]QUS35829.1 alpha/beta fold hydrolase [Falsirhodobacter algicola]